MDQSKISARFTIEIPGGNDVKKDILQKLQQVKIHLKTETNMPANNAHVLDRVLSYYLQHHGLKAPEDPPVTHLTAGAGDTDDRLFIISESSMKLCLDVAEKHGRKCSNKLAVKHTSYQGHVMKMKIRCHKSHQYRLASSPYLPDNRFLVNEKVGHGLHSCGMLPVQYTRFCSAAGIGQLSRRYRKEHLVSYKGCVQAEYSDSCETALLEEIAGYEHLQGINIMTDARHGWRKNAKDSSIVAIGEYSHKVLTCQHVTKRQDHVSQRHEMIGTEQVYDYMEEKQVSVQVHAHDRNLSVNKFIRGKETIINQNDTWHGVKSVAKSLSAVSTGPKYKHGSTWHEQLTDKVQPIKTHFHYAIRNCNGDSDKLKSSLLNVIEHYKNNHSDCSSSSRCKKDPNYEPSRIVLTSQKAIALLKRAVENTVIYKYPNDFNLGKDTFYVESFNNVMNVFQDKRIAFSDSIYNMRSQLAVCHWNENVNRNFTSEWQARAPGGQRCRKKKNYKSATYDYRGNVWSRYMSRLF